MWLRKGRKAILDIKQIGLGRDTGDGQFSWTIKWELEMEEGNVSHKVDNLLEPFTQDLYENVAIYLDKKMDHPLFDQGEADEISPKIDKYRTDLFHRMEILEKITTIRADLLEIHIWPDAEHVQQTRSIHSIEWEQLEDLELWSGISERRIQLVTVYRQLNLSYPKRKLSLAHTNFETAGVSTIEVLLVVARPHIHDDSESARKPFSILNPATIRKVLLQLQEELRTSGSAQKVNLEIVRPGCFNTLKSHLKDRFKAYNGSRPYHIIHFDMHGAIDSRNVAYLEFNGYDFHSKELTTTPVYAKHLGPLLYEHNVKCVVLNACKSAVAHKGSKANLSADLLDCGVPAVLGMSHNMHDSVSDRFYSKFYRELLVQRETISVAASKARVALFNDRSRYNYNNGKVIKMQDWFIPVTYCSTKEAYRFKKCNSWFSTSIFGNSFYQDSCLSAIAILVIHFFSSDQFRNFVSILLDRHHDFSSFPKLKAILSSTIVCFAILRAFLRMRDDWTVRQWLQHLAEDRQNSLRLEADLSRGRIVFLHSDRNVENEAGFFLGSLAAIWQRTHFVVCGGAIDAEWFVLPDDLSISSHWKLLPKAYANWICIRVYGVRHRRLRAIGRERSIVIVKHLDMLYPEPTELRRMPYYALAQTRFEDWLRQNFPVESKRTAPLLLLTALRGRVPQSAVSKWLDNGPGQCEILKSVVTTAFAKLSINYKDPTNKLFYSGKWYDQSFGWICRDASSLVKCGIWSALLDFPKTWKALSR